MIRFVVTCVAGLCLASSANALSYTITAAHTGAQETPPILTTLGIGSLTGTYDDVTNALTWSGTFTGLSGTTTDAHFHGPAGVGVGPAGVTVATNAGSGDTFPLGVTSGSFSGSAAGVQALTATQETQLLAGLWYHNIHSDLHPGGEIRGQVLAVPVPEPAAFALLALGLLGLARADRPV